MRHGRGRKDSHSCLRLYHCLFLFCLSPGTLTIEISTGFVTDIVGIPKAEANAIIHYLNELISTTQEISVRFQWQKNDVAMWDNRICVSITPLVSP